MIGAMTFGCLFIGALVFTKYLKHFEIRNLIMIGILINVIGCFMGLIQSLRWNLDIGLDDLTFVIFTTTITDTLILAF